MKKTVFFKIFSALCFFCTFLFGELTAQTWDMVDISQLSPGDIFMIVDINSGRALANDGGASAAPAAVAVSFNDDTTQVTSVVDDNLKWNIGSEEDGYVFYPNGDNAIWLYCNNTNNGVRVGTNGNKHFIFAEGQPERLKNVETNRWVGVYNNSNWRCYTTYTQSNIVNTKTRFFRYTEIATSIATPTFTFESGTYYRALSIGIQCETPDVTIHYTTDGSIPTTDSPVYGDEIQFSAAGTYTLKAIAFSNEEQSNMAAATYTITLPVEVASIADLISLGAGETIYNLTGTVTITLFNGGNRHQSYIQDATGGMLIDDQSNILENVGPVGRQFNNLICKLQAYGGWFEIVPLQVPDIADINPANPEEVAVEDIDESYVGKLIAVRNLTIDGSGDFEASHSYNFNESGNIVLRTQYPNFDYIGTPIPTGPQDIIGVLGKYNTTLQLIPRSLADFSATATDCSQAPTLDECNAVINEERALVFSSQILSYGNTEDCLLLDHGFVYSEGNTMPELNGIDCQAVSLGNSIELNTIFSHTLNVLGFAPYYVRAFAINNADTTYSAVMVAYPAEPLTWNITYSANGEEFIPEDDYFTQFTEGDAEMALPKLGECGRFAFIGWTTETFAEPTNAMPEVFTTYTPTGDTHFTAVFARVGESQPDTIQITRADFAEGALAFGTDDTCTVVSFTNAEPVTVVMDLYSTATQTTLQTRTNTPIGSHPHNLNAMPGAITEIQIAGGGSGSPRTWTPYLSSTPLTKENFETEGTMTWEQTAETNNETTYWNFGLSDNHYFYLKLTGGSTQLASITIVYDKASVLYTPYASSDTTEIDQTICEGTVYNEWPFSDITEAGDYTFSEEMNSNCTMYYNLHITTTTPDTIHYNVDTCDFFILNDETITSDTTIYIETPNEASAYNAYACPTIESWDIHIREISTNETQETACTSFTWGDTVLTTSGDYIRTFTAANGCDSTVTLHLTINNADLHEDFISSCESYEWVINDETFILTESGDYTELRENEFGCMDTFVLHLTIHEPYSTVINAEICDGNSYTENGFNESQEGTYYQHLQTEYGCDSTIVLELTVSPIKDTTLSIEECGSYTWNDETFFESTNTDRVLVSSDGCDSIIHLNITIKKGEYSETTDATCESTYEWAIGERTFTYTSSGDYTEYTENENGCTDTNVLHLTINSPVSVVIYAQICEGETYNQNGFNETEAGTYTQELSTIAGCDSTVTLYLTVGAEMINNISDEICLGNPYHDYGFDIPEPVAGTTEYRDTIIRDGGCDSIVVLTLTVNEPKFSEFRETACDSFAWNNVPYYESGEFTQTFTAANGCDSIVTLHLTINHSVIEQIEATACDSFAWNNVTYYESGDYTQTFTAANGCDSVVTLNLTINHTVIEQIEDTACDSFAWNNVTYYESGDYMQTFTAANGCDSTVTLTLTINHAVTELIEATACDSFAWNDVTYYESGDYTQTFTAANGCDSTVVLNLTLFETPEAVIDGPDTLTIGNVATLTASEGESYLWNTGDTTASIEVSPEDTTTYYVIITNGNDCSDTAYFTLNVLPTGIDGFSGIECSVYPNPAKDFVMVIANSLKEVHLYSVSGQLIRSYKANNASQCRIGTAGLAPSTYFLRIVTSEGMTTKKIIIRH